MSGFGQTGVRPASYLHVDGERGVVDVELLLYGLNEAGEPAFAERLQPHQRHELRARAAAHLDRHHAVEVWEGPTCILRLRRGAEQG
jgi:hypothetical protein